MRLIGLGTLVPVMVSGIVPVGSPGVGWAGFPLIGTTEARASVELPRETGSVCRWYFREGCGTFVDSSSAALLAFLRLTFEGGSLFLRNDKSFQVVRSQKRGLFDRRQGAIRPHLLVQTSLLLLYFPPCQYYISGSRNK